MDTLRDNVEDLMAHIGQYIDARKDLLVLQASQKAAAAAAQTAVTAVLSAIGAIAFFFFNLAASFWLAERWGSAAQGMAAVGAFWIVAAVLFFLIGRPLIRRAINAAAHKFLYEND